MCKMLGTGRANLGDNGENRAFCPERSSKEQLTGSKLVSSVCGCLDESKQDSICAPCVHPSLCHLPFSLLPNCMKQRPCSLKFSVNKLEPKRTTKDYFASSNHADGSEYQKRQRLFLEVVTESELAPTLVVAPAPWSLRCLCSFAFDLFFF